MKNAIRTIRFAFKTVKRISGCLEELRIRVYASQAAFFIIISAVPMLMTVLTAAAILMPDTSRITSLIEERLPSAVSPVLTELVSEVSGRSDPSLLSVSAVTMLWAASRGIRGIGGGVRNVYGGKRSVPYPLYLLRSLLVTVLYVFSLVLALTEWVFGDIILKSAGQGSPIGFSKVGNSGALFMLLSAVFMLTYRTFGGRSDVREAPGAFIAAGGWFLYSEFFEFYVESFGRYSYLHGSLAALIVVMVWLYSCMEILLIGAAVNLYLSNRRGGLK